MRTRTTIVRIAARTAAVVAVTAASCAIPVASAGATTYPNGGNPPEVNPNNAATAVAGKQVARSTLPFTGTDVAELAAIAGVSAGIGLVMVRRSRRPSTA